MINRKTSEKTCGNLDKNMYDFGEVFDFSGTEERRFFLYLYLIESVIISFGRK